VHEKFHGGSQLFLLKRIRGKREIQNRVNCMENSLKNHFPLEPARFESKDNRQKFIEGLALPAAAVAK
jgi:hypothetical protein